jgi:hypothetical protein
MKTLLFFAFLLIGCGREGLPPYTPAPYEPKPYVPWDPPRPVESELSLKYATLVDGIRTECFVTKTVNTTDLGLIYERYCDFDGNTCTFGRREGYPYPEFRFVITTKMDPPDTDPGLCNWNLPEAI